MPARMRPDPLTLVSAVLIVFSFPHWDLSFLIWFALVPWLAAVARAKSYKDAAIQGVWLSFFMTLGGYYWVAYSLHHFGNLPWAVSIFGLLIFALINQLQFPVYAVLHKWLWNRFGRGNVGLTVLAALAYAGIDWLLPTIFQDTLGHSQHNAPWVRQAADIGGAFLLSFLIVLVNDVLYAAYRGLRDRNEPSLHPWMSAMFPRFALAGALVAATLGYGIYRTGQIERLVAAPVETLTAGVIQANIGDIDKLAAEAGLRRAADKVITTYLDLSERALTANPKPDFLVWPETAYPSTFRTPNTSSELARQQAIERFVRTREIPLLFGGYDFDGKHDYNSLFMLYPRASAELGGDGDMEVYHKNVLLLFGEYIPGIQWFPSLGAMFPQVGNFGRGPGPSVYNLTLPEGRRVKTAPVICYEILLPEYVIDAARQGSQFILNITNDSWFGPYGEPYLHLALSVFRSIETRQSQLRATNTGFSVMVRPDGEITHRSGLFKPEVLNMSVPIIAPVPTLMVMWGDWFGPAALVVALPLLFWLGWRARSTAQKPRA